MTSFFLRLDRQYGEHFHCTLFAGPDQDHRANCGTLTLREPEFTVLSVLTRQPLVAFAEERFRQVDEEGRSFAHDDTHEDGELAAAAAAYALAAAPDMEQSIALHGQELWPWADGGYKPALTPLRNLTKAGALLVAEFDRIVRTATKGT